MPLSAQEQELLALQTDLLREAQSTVLAGRSLNDIMAPILLEEAGYDVVRSTEDILNPEYASAQKAFEEVSARMKKNEKYFALAEDGSLRLSREGRGFLNEGKQKEIRGLMEQYNTAKAKLNTVEQFSSRAGDIIGANRRAPTPTETLRDQNEEMLLERQQQALRGELPVAPGLLADLDQQEEDLRAALAENLGPGYETSTPAIEALAAFREKKAALLEATRRDDIAQAGGLANQIGSFTQGVRGNNFNMTQGTTGSIFNSGSALAQIAGGYSGPMQFMQNNRALDFQIEQANNGPGLLESLFAQGAGTAMTFGLADIFDV